LTTSQLRFDIGSRKAQPMTSFALKRKTIKTPPGRALEVFAR
jgi:hypothetical protein